MYVQETSRITTQMQTQKEKLKLLQIRFLNAEIKQLLGGRQAKLLS